MTPGFGFERPGIWAARTPALASILLLGLLAAAVFLLPNLRFEEDINRVFLSDSQRSQDYRAFLNSTGGEAPQIVVMVEKGSSFSATDYSAMRDLALEFEFIDGVENALSPFAVRFPPGKALAGGPFESLAGQPLIPDDLEIETLDNRLAAFAQTAGVMRPLLASDKKSLLYIVNLAAGTAPERVDEAIAEIEAVSTSTLPAELTATLTGEAVISHRIARALQADLLMLNALGSLLVVVLGLLYFRDWRSATVAVVPALLGAMASLIVFVVLDYPLTVMSNVIPLLVLILGIADSMHLVSRLRGMPDSSIAKRVEATIRHTGPACALTALTTALAFFAIALTDNAQLFEFAIAGGISVMLSFLVLIIAFGVLSTWLAPKAVSSAATPSASTWDQVVLKPFRACLNIGKFKVIAVGGLLFAIAAFGYGTTQPWFPYEDNLPRSSGLKESNGRLTETFGGTYQLWIEVPVERDDGAMTSTGWKRLQDVETAVRQVVSDYPLVSLSGIARWLGDDSKEPSSEDLSEIPERLLSLLNPKDQDVTRVLVQVPEPMRNAETRALQDRLEEEALAAGAVRVVGLPIIMRHESLSIISQLGQGLLIACFGGCVLIALAFRTPVWAFVLLLPNLFPLLVTGAALHFLNEGQLTPTAVLALTIAFGIAVDDSIHFLNSYSQAKAQGSTLQTALVKAMNGSGMVILATTFLLCIGLTVTFLSDFHPVQIFGTMLMLTFVTAVIADLIFLPALLRLGDRDT